MIAPVYICNTNCITPLGFDVASNWKAIVNGQSGIKQHTKLGQLENFYASRIEEDKLNEAFSEIESNTSFTRLEKMMILALQPLVNKQKITPKTAFVFSTTKGNITLLENQLGTVQEAKLATLAQKIASYFGFATQPIVISNACVSGIMAVAIAKRMMQAGVYDDAYIVAGDEISEFVLSGFNSFQAMSANPCKPYDNCRDGVTLGEAVAAVYLTKDPQSNHTFKFKIVGDGAINDANHISGPSRTGEGLFRSMESAFKEANISAKDIGFISAHGTATLYNDEMEAIAFNRKEMGTTPLHSLKGYYGHTLGASGLLETVIAMESAKQNQLIPSFGFDELGVSQSVNIIRKLEAKEIKYFLKTASGFGGCNTAVIFEKVK